MSSNSIRDIIISSLTFVAKDTPSSLVAQKLLNSKGRTIIVGSRTKPLGIITDHDFVRLEAYADPYKTYTAEELMSFPIVSVDADISFEEALEVFQKHSIHRFLVMENNEIIGLLTIPILMKFSNFVLEKLREQVQIDGLTQLKNKTSFNQILLTELNNISKNNFNVESMVIFVDIDHFKDVNDTYGHLTGDVVLREFASVIKDQIRIYDDVGRFGGEEFIILLRRINLQSALLFAERLRRSVENVVFNPEHHNIKITISLGVCSLSEGNNITDALSKADDALYLAKNAGRNRIGYWDETTLKVFQNPTQ